MLQIKSICVFSPLHAGDAVGTAVGVEENGARVGNAVGARDGVPVVGEVVLGPRVGFRVRGANRQDGV